MLRAEPSARASDEIQDGSLKCHRCGRHRVLVEPLSERRRILTLSERRRRCQPRSAHSAKSSTRRQSFAGYVEAIELYVELPTTDRRLRRDKLVLARQLHR